MAGVALFEAEVKRLPLKGRFYREVLSEVELPNPSFMHHPG